MDTSICRSFCHPPAFDNDLFSWPLSWQWNIIYLPSLINRSEVSFKSGMLKKKCIHSLIINKIWYFKNAFFCYFPHNISAECCILILAYALCDCTYLLIMLELGGLGNGGAKANVYALKSTKRTKVLQSLTIHSGYFSSLHTIKQLRLLAQYTRGLLPNRPELAYRIAWLEI